MSSGVLTIVYYCEESIDISFRVTVVYVFLCLNTSLCTYVVPRLWSMSNILSFALFVLLLNMLYAPRHLTYIHSIFS